MLVYIYLFARSFECSIVPVTGNPLLNKPIAHSISRLIYWHCRSISVHTLISIIAMIVVVIINRINDQNSLYFRKGHNTTW